MVKSRPLTFDNLYRRTQMAATATKPVVKTSKPKRAKNPWEGREVKYAEVDVIKFGVSGEPGLDSATARELLGWQTEEEAEQKFNDEFLFKDGEGNKVRCLNNPNNRPFYKSNCDGLVQEILYGRWKMNGETCIITRTGLVQNGQHTLAAVVIAEQVRAADPKRWKKYWEGPVSIPKLVTTGIEDDDDTINTLDTAKPRTFADVLFRSALFADTPPNVRATLTRVAARAIRVLEDRTGALAGADAWSKNRTHGEQLEFLSRHLRICDAIKHVWSEDDGGELSKIIRAGDAAALLYLMGTSGSDPEGAYAKNPREKNLDFSHWDKAMEFWGIFKSGQDTKEIRDAINGITDANTGEGGASASERIALTIQGWVSFLKNGLVKAKDLNLEYGEDAKGNRCLIEHPTCGGIDKGPKNEQDKPGGDDTQAGESEDDDTDPTDSSTELGEPSDPEGESDEVNEAKKNEGPKPEKPRKKKVKANSDDTVPDSE